MGISIKEDFYRFTADIAAYDKGHIHMLMFADAVTAGIIKQFPEKFAK